MRSVRWLDRLDSDAEQRVRALLLAARDVDGGPEVGAEGPLPGEFAGGQHLLCTEGAELGEDAELVGYAHLDTAGDAFGRQVAELIVHPAHRRAGVAGAMLPELTAKAAPGADTLRIWSHGDHPGAAALAERAGLHRARELLVLLAVAEGADWPAPRLPAGLHLRTFEPGRDEQALVAVNGRAFAWHPEQGNLGVDDLRAEQAQPWFDPDGFFLAEDASGGLAGFHWTKIHPATPGRFGGEPVGEVYVLGVDPSAQGGGLGKALTLAGLRYLRERGLRKIILYVEGDNAPAIAVYRKLGFTDYKTDVQYAT